MTKSDLIQTVLQKYPTFNQEQIEAVVNTALEIIKEALEKGDKVEIRGFGSFRRRRRDPRAGRNPKTGEKVSVPEKWVPFFKAGKELKALVDS